MKRKIYVASSWKNLFQPHVVDRLRREGHEVYDFRNPEEDDHGFSWQETDPDWQNAPLDRYLKALEHPAAERGFAFDMVALDEADACVLVLPCGRSAHLELGYAVGRGKPTFVLLSDLPEERGKWELMYKMCDRLATTMDELVEQLVSTVIAGPGHWLGCTLNRWHSGDCMVGRSGR